MKSGFEFFDKIYVINLKSNSFRRSHIVKEFSSIGISNYEFFNGISATSTDVAIAYKSRLVKRFPPCFRCGSVSCECPNNILIPQQVGNWCSFIKLMHHIIRNNYKYVMVCEDDVKFIENSVSVFDQLINLDCFSSYKIKLNEPILIRMASTSYPLVTHNSCVPHFLRDDLVLSNSCFMVNYEYAKIFISTLGRLGINHTSDVFIHAIMVLKNKFIQALNTVPRLAYDLTHQDGGGFTSEIRPKGLKVRVSSEKEYKLLLNQWQVL